MPPNAAVDPAPLWVLAPGSAVARRPPAEVQVGSGPRALVLADRPGLRPLLEQLAGPGAAWRPGCHDLAWRLLRERGLVVPAAALRDDLRRATRTPHAARVAPAVAASYAVHGSAAPAALARRRSVVLGLAGRADWCAGIAQVLGDAGATTRVVPDLPGADRDPRPPAVWLLADLPDATDALLRADVPHLPLAPTPCGGVRIGPFTYPGATACVHCLAAAATDRDPLAPLVELQRVREARRARRGTDDPPPPADPALVTAALGWAAGDLLRWADGGRPRTWSATVEVVHDRHPVPVPWPVHPRCGCGWAA